MDRIPTSLQSEHEKRENETANIILEERSENLLDTTASWKNQTDFIITLIAYAIGLGNVWRFPYLCYKHGGGAFLVPYCLSWVLLAAPIFLLEVGLGQYLQRGSIGVWHICPAFKGVGVSNVIVSCLCNIYYCVISVWSMFYIFASFNVTLPWEACGHYWNDDYCLSEQSANTSLGNKSRVENSNTQTPVAQFWFNRVLQSTGDIEDVGSIQWELLALLAAVWLGTFFLLWRGITKARKVFYVCAIVPYVLLLILLIRGTTLPGALTGIKVYLTPNVSKLLDISVIFSSSLFHNCYFCHNFYVWRDAGTQVFYSSGIGYGSLIALGSHNKFHHNVYRDSILMCAINAGTSLTAGFAVFSILGHLAESLRKPVSEVVQSGVGLVFQVYPEAVKLMPLGPFWSRSSTVKLLLQPLLCAFSFSMCVVNGVIEGISEGVAKVMKQRKKQILAIVCLTKFLLGIPLVTYSGQYWLTLIDYYGAGGIPLLFIAFFEVIAIAWIFGASRLRQAMSEMVGFRISAYWTACWRYLTPLWLLALFSLVSVIIEPLKYASGIPYPNWAQVLGILMETFSILPIPVFICWSLVTASGPTFKEKFIQVFATPPDHRMSSREEQQT
uniref:Transporter n=1 Tax=Trichuris muris TaxID=70415 RepID=A0A5S6Q7Y4_TRIMR